MIIDKETKLQKYNDGINLLQLRYQMIMQLSSPEEIEKLNYSSKELIDELDFIKRSSMSNRSSWLNWDEIKEMSQFGISFGAHTHNHFILTQIPINIVKDEICTSKQVLSKNLGCSVNLFCYPNGNYSPDIINTLREEGFEFAVTTEKGTINKSSDNLLLKRFLLHEDMTKFIPQLACKLTDKIPYF